MASFHPLAVSPIERTHTSPSARTGETASRHRPIGGSIWPAGRVSALLSWFSLASVWCNTMQLGMYSQGSYRKRKNAKQNLLRPLPGTPSQTCIAGVAFMSWIFRCLWRCGVMRAWHEHPCPGDFTKTSGFQWFCRLPSSQVGCQNFLNRNHDTKKWLKASMVGKKRAHEAKRSAAPPVKPYPKIQRDSNHRKLDSFKSFSSTALLQLLSSSRICYLQTFFLSDPIRYSGTHFHLSSFLLIACIYREIRLNFELAPHRGMAHGKAPVF